MNPDFEFAFEMLRKDLDESYNAHQIKEFETADRYLRIAGQRLADMRRANRDMMRWAHQ